MNDAAPEKVRPSLKAFPLTRRTVITFSVVATIIFTSLFLIITIYVREQSLSSIFTAGQPLATQILTGLLLGITIAIFVLFILLKTRFFAQLRNFIKGILGEIRPTGFDMLIVALFAGIGEELFFRATLQPFVGLWPASLVFALSHMGISVKPAKLAFAGFVLAMGLLLGTLYERSGLISAIVLHAVYDLIFLLGVKRFLQSHSAIEG